MATIGGLNSWLEAMGTQAMGTQASGSAFLLLGSLSSLRYNDHRMAYLSENLWSSSQKLGVKRQWHIIRSVAGQLRLLWGLM